MRLSQVRPVERSDQSRRLDAFRHYSEKRRSSGTISEIVSSDRIFQRDPDGAYAESWALTFYLAESQPRKYFNYLAKTAARPPFEEYRAPERLKDFTSVFGENFTMLDARMVRFIQGLK